MRCSDDGNIIRIYNNDVDQDSSNNAFDCMFFCHVFKVCHFCQLCYRWNRVDIHYIQAYYSVLYSITRRGTSIYSFYNFILLLLLFFDILCMFLLESKVISFSVHSIVVTLFIFFLVIQCFIYAYHIISTILLLHDNIIVIVIVIESEWQWYDHWQSQQSITFIMSSMTMIYHCHCQYSTTTMSNNTILYETKNMLLYLFFQNHHFSSSFVIYCISFIISHTTFIHHASSWIIYINYIYIYIYWLD